MIAVITPLLFSQLLVTGEDFQRYYAMKERSRRTATTAQTLDKWFAENEDWRPYADLVACPPLVEEMMAEYTDISPEALSRSMEMVMEGGGYVSRGAIYLRVRREGEERGRNADRWATMLCLNAPPGIQTTDSFWAGRQPWHQVFGEEYANNVKAKLRNKGINLKAGDEYMPELARFQGDPEAVVPYGGGRSYIKKLCETRGWACEGAVNVSHREPEEDPLANENCPMAPDLIRRKGINMLKKDPSLNKLDRREMKAAVLERFGPSK